MTIRSTLAFEISRDFSGLSCDIHHTGISTRNSKDFTLVKVCCRYFKAEVETALIQKYGDHFVKANIRLQTPVAGNLTFSSGQATPED